MTRTVNRLRKSHRKPETPDMPTVPPSPASAAADRNAPSERPPDPALLADAAETFAMLATPTRVHLLWLLARGQHDVGSLAEHTQATVPSISQHLAKLRLAGLVTAHRQGRHQVYVVDDPHVLSLIDQALDHHAQLRNS